MKNFDLLIKNQVIDASFMNLADEFCELLLKWNKVHSVTTANTKQEIMDNIFDSIYPLSFVEKFSSFVDVGTGAGFPGFIIAMARPDMQGFLVEPRSKRVAFLNFALNSLGLKNTKAICKRIEDVTECQNIDLITSRAVGDAKLLLALSNKLSSVQTRYLFYKGSSVAQIDDLAGLDYELFGYGENRKYLYIKG